MYGKLKVYNLPNWYTQFLNRIIYRLDNDYEGVVDYIVHQSVCLEELERRSKPKNQDRVDCLK